MVTPKSTKAFIKAFIETHVYRKYIKLKGCKHIGINYMIKRPITTHGLKNVIIGDYFKCGERLKLRTFTCWGNDNFDPKIIIGNNVNIESDCHISAINNVTIDDGVLIASFVYISDHSHGNISKEMLQTSPIHRPLISKGPIHICKNVWLGERVCVLPNVTIGEGSIIGANSVVTKDIPPFSVACGSPAKVIKTLI